MFPKAQDNAPTLILCLPVRLCVQGLLFIIVYSFRCLGYLTIYIINTLFTKQQILIHNDARSHVCSYFGEKERTRRVINSTLLSTDSYIVQ